MPKPPTDPIDDLLQRGEWRSARTHIQQELGIHPHDHWLMTQLAVTYYEEHDYHVALAHCLKSLEIVPDCPLTLWNVAGVLDAMDNPKMALSIYTWLLKSDKTPDDDACWESRNWTDSLKTDCVYRIGRCMRHLDKPKPAENCFRQYINIILTGISGTYPIDEAARHIREIHESDQSRQQREQRKAIRTTVKDSRLKLTSSAIAKLPKLSLPELLAAHG